MCGKCDCGCEKPERLKKIPKDCSPEQVVKCHGDMKKHPCTEPAQKK
jgi:hypothetical protein